jgi:polyhydroxybutyrate depolymerase
MYIKNLIPLLWAGVLMLGSFVNAAPAYPTSATTSSTIQQDTIKVDGRVRDYLAYIPKNLPAHSPLLFVLHGSLGRPQQMRKLTAYRFERLADQYHFIVIYPAGFGEHWNDCRKRASYSARTQHIDDVGFIRHLVARFHTRYHIDPARVYAMGYSNGGHMAYRLALEAPDLISGIAAVSANLPVPENSDCQISHKPVSVMIMNGTADPINPYHGGNVTIFGFGNRGKVMSSLSTATWFAQQNKAKPAGVGKHLPHSGLLWAERSVWKATSGKHVELVTIHGGGHTLPQSTFIPMGFLGLTYTGMDGPEEIWNFFAKGARQNNLSGPKNVSSHQK